METNLTKQQVIDSIKESLEMGNAVLFASIGQGGAGASLWMPNGYSRNAPSDEEQISSYLEEYEMADFLGKVEDDNICDDIKEDESYTEDSQVYGFETGEGSYIQVVIYL